MLPISGSWPGTRRTAMFLAIVLSLMPLAVTLAGVQPQQGPPATSVQPQLPPEAAPVSVQAGPAPAQSGAEAAAPSEEEPAALRPGRGPTDATDVETFIDGVMSAHLEAYDIAGATVAVVRDGEVLLAKGYGFADVEERRKVDDDVSLFRIGSISKLFVWIAVMQLVEQNRLDLNTDINEYVDAFDIAEAFHGPVTMADLMTHGAGFEDQVIGLFSRDEASLRELPAIIADEMPRRVRPAGEAASYSNHGTGMAAHVVEAISGLDFIDYVERNITGPLGMSHTTLRQPVPAHLIAYMSKGYTFSDRKFDEKPFEFVPLAPVGAVSASAADMARLMIMFLREGAYGPDGAAGLDGTDSVAAANDIAGQGRILRASSMRRALSPLHRHAPEVNPMGHGFIDSSSNGEWVIGHGGRTLWFHSDLALLPDHEVGVFVSYNSARGRTAKGAFMRQFMDHYFPFDDPEEIAPPADLEAWASRASRYEGSYRANRYSHSTIAKIGALGAVEVSATDDGALMTSSTGRIRWLEVSPLVFREEMGHDRLVFREDADGNITHLFLSGLPIIAFDRLSAYETPRTHAVLAVSSALLLILTVVLWPIAALVRSKHGYEVRREHRLPTGARLSAWTGAALMVVFAAGLAFALADPNEIVFGVARGLILALWMPLLAIPFAAATVVWTVILWREARAGFWTRVIYTLLALAFIVTYWLLHYWNLLGFRY